MTTFQLRAFETEVITNTRALIYLWLYGSVAERIKHAASYILTYRETNSNPVRSSLHGKSSHRKVSAP